MKMEKYLIKKGKLDLLSSLKALDKKLLEEKFEEYEVSSLSELKDSILNDFEFYLDSSKDDIFTRMYFERLVDHENTVWMSAYRQDIDDLIVFVYDNGNHYSYYIPTEIRQLINKILGF